MAREPHLRNGEKFQREIDRLAAAMQRSKMVNRSRAIASGLPRNSLKGRSGEITLPDWMWKRPARKRSGPNFQEGADGFEMSE
jgi:hypothetical protein